MSLNGKLTLIQDAIVVPKNQRNNFGNYNYRNAEDIQLALKPLLKEHELSLTITDEIVWIGERYYIKATATLFDDSSVTSSITTTGYAREAIEKKGMDASQITGSTSSYARKYALCGMFLLDDEKDADSQDTTTTQQNDTPEKPWYNDFKKHEAEMKRRIGQGEAASEIVKSLEENFKLSKQTKDSILKLGVA